MTNSPIIKFRPVELPCGKRALRKLWCYLKLTYRAAFPFITIRTQYDVIKQQIEKELLKTDTPVMFNSGELADSLAMEHLTRAGREFIPWFGKIRNGFLFMLTKSDNVDAILKLPHNHHTILTWSINHELVSRKFEIGAPPFEKRLEAARKAQGAGYPVRLRLDPVVPVEGWQDRYSETIKDIFAQVTPERITIGTLRFEKGFYDQRYSIFTTGRELSYILEKMQQMFPPKEMGGFKNPKSGKYSFSDEQRFEIFRFIINEIRKYSDCTIALCRESATLWDRLKLDLSHCRCVCQYDFADIK